MNLSTAFVQAADFLIKAVWYGVTQYPKTPQGEKELNDVLNAIDPQIDTTNEQGQTTARVRVNKA